MHDLNTAYLYIRLHGVYGEYADTVHWYTSLTTYCNEHFISTHSPVVCEEPNFPYVANTRFRARPMGGNIYAAVKSGDVIIAPDASTVFISYSDMLNTLVDLEKRGVGMVILDTGCGTLDTTTCTGKYAAKQTRHHLAMLRQISSTRHIVTNTGSKTSLSKKEIDLARRLSKLHDSGLRGKALARRYLLATAKNMANVPPAADVPEKAIRKVNRLIKQYRNYTRIVGH